jgi:hypothetical protein
MDDGVDNIRGLLSGKFIPFDKLDDNFGIFDEVDAFVNQSRENQSVTSVTLYVTPDPDAQRYAIWDKIAEGIGNLQALEEIQIVDHTFANDEEDPLASDWEILACILRRLRHGIQLYLRDGAELWDMEALQVFAGVIHGQAMITGFITGAGFHFDCLDILCSALLTLPALANVSFEQLDGQGPEEEQSLESMIELLQLPSLREVKFLSVVFTNTLCQAVAKALKERSGIIDLRFQGCFFPEGGTAVIASVLKTNTTLKYVGFYTSGTDEVFYEVLAKAVRSNSTLQNLECSAPDDSGSCSWLSPLFLALQENTGLKVLGISGIDLIDEKLSTAMRIGLAKNSMLESLYFWTIRPDDNDACLWQEALSFLRTNTALKTLAMDFEYHVTESRVATIRMEVPAVLRENETLETLSMKYKDARFEDYLAFIAAIHPNTTLKSLRLRYGPLDVDKDEMKDLIPVLKKNYGLEAIPDFYQYGSKDVNSIFDLNRAGRRYLVQDGSSISKGVAVLSRVNDDINSVFLHLLENPRLCVRNAVEISSASIGPMDNAVRSTPSPGNRHSGGKREQQAPSHMDTETRRRLE